MFFVYFINANFYFCPIPFESGAKIHKKLTFLFLFSNVLPANFCQYRYLLQWVLQVVKHFAFLF